MPESTVNRAPRGSGLVIHDLVPEAARAHEVILKQEIVRELGYLSIEELQQVHVLISRFGQQEPATAKDL